MPRLRQFGMRNGSRGWGRNTARVQSLARNALHHRVRFEGLRRAPVRRFKFYGVYYLVQGFEIWVIAVYHGRRHPRHLQERREAV